MSEVKKMWTRPPSKSRFEVKTETGMATAGFWVNNYKDSAYYVSVMYQEMMVQKEFLVHSNFTPNI